MERNILKEYEELTSAEKAQVDSMVSAYKDDSATPESYTMRHIEEDEDGTVHTSYVDVNDNKRISSQQVEEYLTRLVPHISKINEKLEQKDMSVNKQQNELRMKLFEDRMRNGYYNRENPQMNPAPVNVNINNSDSSEVKALKDEVSSLKEDINGLKQLLIEKLK